MDHPKNADPIDSQRSFVNRVLPSKISVVVSTYNWPDALHAVLGALINQKTDHAFEIIVADDGSSQETAQWVQSVQKKTDIPLIHVWHPDEGFRVAAIRNKAIIAAQGDYIVFLDGDCIPREDFIRRHRELAEFKTFVVGHRILLSRAFTRTVLSEPLPLHQWSLGRWCVARFCGHCNRIAPLLSWPSKWPRFKSTTRWQGAKGCNLGVWKDDLIHINGWEEKFTGWGYEDSDLVMRLLRSHIHRKSGRFSIPVFHLWHPQNDRSRERDNWRLLKEREQRKDIRAEQGLDQYEPLSKTSVS